MGFGVRSNFPLRDSPARRSWPSRPLGPKARVGPEMKPCWLSPKQESFGAERSWPRPAWRSIPRHSGTDFHDRDMPRGRSSAGALAHLKSEASPLGLVERTFQRAGRARDDRAVRSKNGDREDIRAIPSHLPFVLHLESRRGQRARTVKGLHRLFLGESRAGKQSQEDEEERGAHESHLYHPYRVMTSRRTILSSFDRRKEN